MNDKVTQDLIFETLKAIRAELSLNSEKIGAMAQAVVGVQREMHDLKQETRDMRQDIRTLHDAMSVLSIAVDEHTRRLDRINERLGLNNPTH